MFLQDSSPAALDAIALFLYGDEIGVQQARSVVLERARAAVRSFAGSDIEQFEQLVVAKAGALWHEGLVEGIESLNLPAVMRPYWNSEDIRNRTQMILSQAALKDQ